MLAACVVLVGVAAWLLVGPRALTRLHSAPHPRAGRLRSPSAKAGVSVAVAGGGVVATGWLFGRSVGVVAAVCALAGLTVLRLGALAVARRRSRAARREIAEACQVLAQLVAVGRTPAEALQLAARDCPVFAEAAAAQRMGADPSESWRGAAAGPGRSGLRTLARAWQVGQATGASMVRPLHDTADALRGDERLAATVRAELAAPRATGRMLAVLPVFGLALGQLVGSHPGAFLLHQTAGQACLLAGSALVCAGVLWVEHLAVARDGP